MRLIAALFLCVTLLGGFTVSGGYIEIAIINAVVFLGLALLATTFAKRRWGKSGLVYGMVGAFMLSLLWPLAIIPFYVGEPCEPGNCKVTIRISPAEEPAP
ncbi:MAG: hypothetical protein ACMUJI_06525 [Erythrobacter sp.]|uniref:hypothetical protein n=1 Tax=Erythrobacter sp. TaxID=1042 RepID=UPI003A8A57E5